jgi:LysR family transcriptional activator of nhaA
VKDLETSLGHRLFERAGRGVKLTEAGRIAFNFANEIFSLGQEMANVLEHQPTGRALKFAVGILDVLPKSIVTQLLEPARKLEQPVRLICREDKADRLLSDLAARRTDLVLTDAPIGTAVQVEAYNHLLGESGVSFLAAPQLASKLKRGFPKSLNGAPMLLPSDHTEVRRSLNHWPESATTVP